MEVLKVKDWKSSRGQFLIVDTKNGIISKVQRIKDERFFQLYEMINVRSVTVQGRKLEIFTNISAFVNDETNVELSCSAVNYPLSSRLAATEINEIESCSSNMISDLIEEMDASFKERDQKTVQ